MEYFLSSVHKSQSVSANKLMFCKEKLAIPKKLDLYKPSQTSKTLKVKFLREYLVIWTEKYDIKDCKPTTPATLEFAW